MTAEPLCAECSDPMTTVVIHHKHGPATSHTICPVCLTGRRKPVNQPAAKPTLKVVRSA